MELNLRGKKALVTGGSSGIGLAIKEALEAEGVDVTSWSRREGADLKKGLWKIPEFDFDIVIHCAGGFGTAGFEEDYSCMKLNYHVLRELTQKFLERQTNWGRIIAISSIYGKEKGPNPLFTAAKTAQIAFMKSLAGRYEGVTFNVICPGHIDVGKPFPDNPKVIGKPEDVAGIVTFLCSDIAKHINGAVITVDGGESYSF